MPSCCCVLLGGSFERTRSSSREAIDIVQDRNRRPFRHDRVLMVPVDVANARFDRSVSFVDPDFESASCPPATF